MKKYLFAFLTSILFVSNAFSLNVPEAVVKAFENKFPNAKKITWDKESANEYEASFIWNENKYSANFSSNGEWLETEQLITNADIPEKVKQSFSSTHTGITMKNASKIETAKGNVKYEIEFLKGLKTIEIFYTSNGDAFNEKH